MSGHRNLRNENQIIPAGRWERGGGGVLYGGAGGGGGSCVQLDWDVGCRMKALN